MSNTPPPRRRVVLLGHPVGHSASPAMHAAAFEALGLDDWRYDALDIAPDALAEAVAALREPPFAGANVTVPHKEAVMEHLDTCSPLAERIGAVNTIAVAADGSLHGDNTDGEGFVADLRAHGVEPWMKRVAVLGAGGAARACIVALSERTRPALITVTNRTERRARELVRALRDHLVADIEVVPWDQRDEAATCANLVVNCTPLGLAPHDDGCPLPDDTGLHANQAVYDMVYRPRRTRLLALAEAAGAQAIGGAGMLLHQGALALRQWTGREAPLEVMRAALEEALRC